MTDDYDPLVEEDRRAHDVAVQQHRARVRDLDRRAATAYVLASSDGRAFLWDLLATCGVWSPSYGEHMAFREGERAVGIKVLARIEEVSPGILHSLADEFKFRELRYSSINEGDPT